MAGADEHPSHAQRAAAALQEIFTRRLSGEKLTDEAIAKAHPDLADRLPDIALVERARVIASIEFPDADSTAIALPNGSVPGYVVLQEINRGGQAVVYLGRSLGNDELVAIKLFHQRTEPSRDDQERFDREASLLASLNHPNIVAYRDRGVASDGRQFIVTRLIEGDSLRVDRLANTHSLSERLALFEQICLAVGAAHAAKIVHRDIKPSNIRIDRAGVPHIIDFGLATRVDSSVMRESLTVTGRFVGTFLWASPEQKTASGRTTAAADVYSLGVILHQLITGGQFPPQVYASLETVAGTSSARGDSFRRTRRLQPRALHNIVQRCLATNPADRFDDANQLAEALVALRNRRPPPPRRIWIGAAVTVLAVAAGLAYFWQSSDWTRRAPHVNGRLALEITLGGNKSSYVWIPPGEFIMGSPPDESGRLPHEKQHTVRIERGFYLQSTEVAQAEYQEIMGTNPSRFQGDGILWRPVERVSYYDAQEYCRRLSERLGKTVRLPTEAEWEYACRAGTTSAWSFGDNRNLIQLYGNIADQSLTDDGVEFRMNYSDRTPHTIPETDSDQGFLQNPWRLLNMHGNLWEWCQAPYLTDPTDPTTLVAGRASARGGSWWDGPVSARSAHRNPLPLDSKTSTLGFRVVIEE